MSRLRIGYVGPDKKWESLKWNKFVEYASERNVDVVHINLDQDFDKQGKFDIIIHKVTYLMNSPYPEENPKIKNLYEFSKKHPEVLLIDDLQNVGKTLDRELLDQAIRSIQWPNDIIVKIPEAKMLEKSDIESIVNSSKDLHFLF
ncbi:ITPK1 protein, putative [Trichomonas vaginalis G3]|uniref:ITPK1 protein, putative n=1 Tax=Trichomonas vaginalis (strain ATCC PRA-98 / G3) TaxID=412133 RepID=A2D8B5_TRIV3|nr:inositol tetrakisphosphate 1-kinase protein [Trichomonas vaginalis G3]EAY23548.1 ITPK1 protein, putative [Trichomonas vaginalis G3]KAI5493970.1 inositol tetrakisphosphate 1-kinase protein [Trichomonas vaginalis G3]|eukprot:XP_001584534.1 ITPK1 protein [Trichomonas vaginalis G3]